jgi:putative hemolysin
VDHGLEIEADDFDRNCEHLMLLDRTRGADLTERLVGVYRIMNRSGAEAAGGFYTASEFDLAPLLATGRPMMELGRSCPAQTLPGGGGDVLSLASSGAACDAAGCGNSLWDGSFAGTDPSKFKAPLSLLGREHLAQAALRPTAIGAGAVPLCDPGELEIDRLTALRAMRL